MVSTPVGAAFVPVPNLARTDVAREFLKKIIDGQFVICRMQHYAHAARRDETKSSATRNSCDFTAPGRFFL
jgi:hypothetical protein